MDIKDDTARDANITPQATLLTGSENSTQYKSTTSTNTDDLKGKPAGDDVVHHAEQIPIRVKYAQVFLYVFMIIAIIFSQINYSSDLSSGPFEVRNVFNLCGMLVSVFVTWVCNFTILYKNTSHTILRKLLREPNVWQVIILSITLFLVDLLGMRSLSMVVRSVAYIVGLLMLMLLDAVERKSRSFILAAGCVYTLLTLYQVFMRIFAIEEENKILLVVYGKNIYIRSVKRSIFANSFVLMLKGLITLYKDTKQEYLMFCTRHVFFDNDDDRNLSAQAQAFNTMPFQLKVAHTCLLVTSVAFIVTFLSRAYENYTLVAVLYAVELFCIYLSMYIIMRGNFASDRFWRVIKQIPVRITLCALTFVFVIDVATVQHKMDIVSSFGYVTCGMLLMMLDTIKVKHRALLLVTGSIFIGVNLFNIYNRIFGDAEIGLILIEPFGRKLYVRDVKRSLFFSILSLALNGLITLYRDRKQERYMFVVDHVNRATGEASKMRESLQYVASRQMSLKSKKLQMTTSL